jgi:hypothetical protein
MQYIFDGEFHKVIRITGPKHNLLGIAFTNEGGKTIEVEALKKTDDKGGTIDAEGVKEQVILGINEANTELGVNYNIRKIQFVPTDTPPISVYRDLAKEIVNKIKPSSPEPRSFQAHATHLN